ncbi:centriolin isoform X1 [Hypanus sabinus]|uniref:centriolin isoform X1 n=1 Tax=Hypanus sabinus TaxID=79690 RepID=UPI0028C38E13|nr:centriolin isoform X1 [Hypanus sabinus]XP_059849795.1 centriolin isoform X1 [Hypanus sabinus]
MRKRSPQLVIRTQASKSETQSPVSSVLNPSTRSPTPTSRLLSPELYNPSDVGEQQLDISDESGSAITYYTGKDTVRQRPGIRYITEDLIKKLSKQEQLGSIQSLNLCLSKAEGKKFKFIENLEKCDHLLVLNLSNNMIEKIEKLEKQLKLRELSLSYNRICKIEGLEHMVNLQNLVLAGNYIEQIPSWVGKKLRSLRVLNLKQNNITSLQDVSKLKPLRELTSLNLADNPLASLPHYRLYVIYHLRSLNSLDGWPVTLQERQEAHERFHLEELENLEKELAKKMKEIELLEQKHSKAKDDIRSQEQRNRTLELEHQQQKNNCRKLEREVETKNELLKQKTVELTRACHKQYQLEQELAFYKIDAKFEPLHHTPTENFNFQEIPNESPYIGKARYKRNQYIQEHTINPVQLGKVGKIQFDVDDEEKNKMRTNLNQAMDVQLEDKEKKIQKAEESLRQLQGEKEKAEQQVLRTVKELKNLEELTAQKQISVVEKEKLKRHFAQKIQLINNLRQETEELEQQMERQWKEMEKKQREILDLEKNLRSIDPKDPRHAHLKAQMVNKTQQFDTMSKQYKQLEKRLDEMLSRIAKETESIKDLEEQLTEGQIAANEALKRDLESIIAGLQEYLESVKGQAKQAREECTELQKEKQALLHQLTELEQEKNQLEIVAMDADNLRKELSDMERSLQEQQELNESLRQAQGDLGEYEAELESQLQARDIEANQLREELERLRKLSQMEQSALQAELEKERQALENALAKAQLVAEKEHENKKLVAQLKTLQVDNSLLKEQLKELQTQMNQTIKTMIHPEEVSACISELGRKLGSGIQEIRPYEQGDTLGKNLAELQKQLNETLKNSQQEKEEILCHCKRLEQEIITLQEELRNTQEDSKTAYEKAAETLIKSEKEISQAQAQQLKNKIAGLQEQLRNMQELQALADEQLQEADENRDKLLQELEAKENKSKMEDARTHLKLCNLEKEVKDLKATMAASDKMAARELSTARDHLKALQGTVHKLNQERTEEMEVAEKFRAEATRAARDLAKAEAEIELLQSLLKDKENQILDEIQAFDSGANSVNAQQLEIERLGRALNRQSAEVKRLQDHLNHMREGNLNEMEKLMNEISALRNVLSNQNDYINSMMDPFKRRGYWYFVPSSPKPPSLRSQNSHTKDSGFSSLHQVPPSPSQGSIPRRGGKEECISVPGGYWVYSPIRRTSQWTRTQRVGDDEDSGTESDGNGTPKQTFIAPPGSVIYTMHPDGTPLPQGTVVYGPAPARPASVSPVPPGTVLYGPPPPGTQVVYGPPPINFTIPLIPEGVLHCNVLEHHDLENEVSKLEDTIAHLRSHKSKHSKTTASIDRHHEQIEQLRNDIYELLQEREELEHEVEELHKVVHKRTNQKDFLDGHIDLLMNELEVEKSLKKHDDVVDEIECVEMTLSKRRAELREADRLLMDAEADLKSTREKSKEIIQQYDDASKRLVDTEKDAEELEQRAHDTAVKLVMADKQLRLMKNDLKDLEQQKAEQESMLNKINKEVSTGNLELQTIVQNMENMTESLEKLQAEILSAETKEKQHLETLEEAAMLLEDKKSELETLNSKVKVMRKELMMLDRYSGKKKEELNFLQSDIDKKKASLSEVLLEGEAEKVDKQCQIQQLKALLEEMSAQKGELNAQITEKNSCLSLTKQEVKNEEDKLQSIQVQINKQKTELKHIVEMVQLENDALLRLKQQHEKKIMELERIQAALQEEKSELENLQHISQNQKAEIERQKQHIEKEQQEVDQLTTKKNSLQHSVESLAKEKKHMGENCLVLENKLSQTKRAVEITEDNNRRALSKLQQLQTELSELNQEINQIKIQKQELNQKMAYTQNLLQEEKAELEKVMDNIQITKDQLQLAEQDIQNVTKKCDMLKAEQVTLKENVNQSASKYKSHLENEKKKEQELLRIQQQIEEKQHKLTEEQKMLQSIKKNVKSEETKLEQSATKLKDQIRTLEAELSDKKIELEQMVTKVNLMEDRLRKVQHNEEQCIILENQIVTLTHQLSDREQQYQETMDELAFLQREIQISKNNVTHLQEWLHSERKKAEKQVAVLTEESKAQRAELEKALNEQKHENNRLQKELSSINQIARDNHAQVDSVMSELNEMRQKYFELKQQLRSQEQMEKRQKEIKEAIRMLRSDVKAEIGNSLKELDQSSVEPKSDLDVTLEEEETLQCEKESLKENFPFAAIDRRHPNFDERLRLTEFNFKDEQWRGEVLRENLRQQEDRLKAQIRQCMSEQAEALCKRRQQTQGNLTNLRRRVDALDELVTSMSVNSSHHYQTDGTSKASLHRISQSPSRRPAERFLQGKHSHLLGTEQFSEDSW